jgi:hypothetical protein
MITEALTPEQAAAAQACYRELIRLMADIGEPPKLIQAQASYGMLPENKSWAEIFREGCR